ncbi:hypothetical protein Bbelb_263750 [Branchiostoma belcheri]|nr:hypothetical protein Bbelb_263750 [Branchiostoma belcheri]
MTIVSTCEDNDYLWEQRFRLILPLVLIYHSTTTLSFVLKPPYHNPIPGTESTAPQLCPWYCYQPTTTLSLVLIPAYHNPVPVEHVCQPHIQTEKKKNGP